MTQPTIDQVTKRFGTTVALDSVSLSIPQGELFFLLGPSGCGKTTLLRILAGFDLPDSGRVLYDGEDMTTVPVEKRNLGVVFQQYALWPHMTVAQNVEFGLRVRTLPTAERRDRVAEVISRVRLIGLEDRFPHQLSGGQQQRVALARAIVLEPGLILLDEPLSNLDPSLRVEMRGEICDLHKTLGITMVYVTHDRDEALSMADRAALLRGGKVLQCGSPSELYNTPHSPFVASFLGDANLLPARIMADGRVACTGLDLCLPPTSALPPGVDAFVLLRPERIRITEVESSETTVRGTVKNRVFLGGLTRLTVEITPNLTLLVVERSPLPETLEPGTPIGLAFSPADMRLLPSEPPS